MIKENYYIRPVDYKTAMSIVITRHYLHRKCPCSQAFGLYKADSDKIQGVVVYGTPSSSPLRKGIAGAEHVFNVLELNRLWVSDDVPKNGESYLIGRTLKLLNKEIIVSYADTSQNHIGYVYQATNWIYTGLSAKRTNWSIPTDNKVHSQTLADKHTAAELREKYGPDFKLVPRSRKHRYIFINAKGKRREKLVSQIKYKVEPYPKGAF